MANVAVLHNTLDFQGGADAVCLATCNALKSQHDVTLITIGKTKPKRLAARFGTDIEGVVTRQPPGNNALAKILSKATGIVGPGMAIRSLLAAGYLGRFIEEFDVVFSTTNELALSIPSVQYIHFPQFHHRKRTDQGFEPLNSIVSAFGGPQTADFRDARLLANSSWTAGVFEDIYDVRPEVVHPPVKQIDGVPWSQRENGIVLLGRIAPDKNILDAIPLIDALRKRGMEYHLHIVGSTTPAFSEYKTRVERAASKREYVSLEPNSSRERITTLLGSHRYGLNLKEDEHFGMSVAEYVSAGMIAFCPDSGGQREILEHRSDRLFTDLSDAIATIIDAIERGDRPTLPRDKYSPDKFRSNINEYVEYSLQRV